VADASTLLWARCRGRSGWESPVDLPDDIAAEARNWHFYEGALGTKRGGSTSVDITGATAINALFRYVPGQDETAAELFVVDNSATNKILRMAAGSSLVNLTLTDNIQANDTEISFVTLNGKLYIAYNSTVNRIHVFDPGLSTTTVRRGGMGTPAAPALATLGGAGLTITRYVKVAYTEVRSSVVVRRSELSPSATITITDDSGFSITKPAAISEGETHWEAYISETADGTYYLDASTVVGTTSYNYSDSAVDTTTAEHTAGAQTPFPSVKYLGTDGNRLYGLGVWETTAGDSMTPKAGRFYFGPVLDSSSLHDDERINNSTGFEGWIDLQRNAGAVDRGVTPRPLNGVIYAFLSKAIYMLIPTESAVAPYRRVQLSSELGALSHQSIVMAEDERGRPCCYFLDPELGPYRIGAGGVQRCGKDVQDIWDTLNPDATGVVAWGQYFKALNLVVFGIATGANNDPDKLLVFDVTEGRYVEADGIRGGWTVWDGDFSSARAGVMFASSIGASMGRELVLYTGNTKFLRYNPSVTSDDSVTFRGYIRSKAHEGGDVMKLKQVLKAYLLAEVSTGVTVTLGLIRNFGDETTRTDTALLTGVGSETRLLKRFESPDLADAYVMQFEIGDASATASAMTLERFGAVLKTGDYKGN
jgi:hypothetical protein